MDITTSLIVIAFIYGIFLFLDNFFKVKTKLYVEK